MYLSETQRGGGQARDALRRRGMKKTGRRTSLFTTRKGKRGVSFDPVKRFSVEKRGVVYSLVFPLKRRKAKTQEEE